MFQIISDLSGPQFALVKVYSVRRTIVPLTAFRAFRIGNFLTMGKKSK